MHRHGPYSPEDSSCLFRGHGAKRGLGLHVTRGSSQTWCKASRFDIDCTYLFTIQPTAAAATSTWQQQLGSNQFDPELTAAALHGSEADGAEQTCSSSLGRPRQRHQHLQTIDAELIACTCVCRLPSAHRPGPTRPHGGAAQRQPPEARAQEVCVCGLARQQDICVITGTDVAGVHTGFTPRTPHCHRKRFTIYNHLRRRQQTWQLFTNTQPHWLAQEPANIL